MHAERLLVDQWGYMTLCRFAEWGFVGRADDVVTACIAIQDITLLNRGSVFCKNAAGVFMQTDAHADHLTPSMAIDDLIR